MIRIYIVIICLLSALMLSARVDRTIKSDDTLKVVNVVTSGSDKSIIADKQKVKIGDKFSAAANIDWPKGVTSIEVYNERTRVRHKLSNKEFDSNIRSIFKAFIRRNSTSSKGGSISEDITAMSDLLSKTFYMIDNEMFIQSCLVIDGEHTFTLTPLNVDGGQAFDLMFNPDEPYTIYISKEMLTDAGINLDAEPVRFSVQYSGGGKTYPVTNYFVIEKAQ